MQYTEQEIAQLVFGIINSCVAHIYVAGRSLGGVYQFPPNTFVGSPDPIKVDRCLKFLIPYVSIEYFLQWLSHAVPVAAHNVIWVGPPRATRIADDECFFIEAEFELLDPFGSPAYCGELLWKDDKIRRFEDNNLRGAA